MYTAESYWWLLTLEQRKQYERVVAAMIAYCRCHNQNPRTLLHTAVQRHYTDSPLVAAVCWRLSQELVQ